MKFSDLKPEEQTLLDALVPGRKVWIDRPMLILTEIKEVKHRNLNGEVHASWGPWFHIEVESNIPRNVILADVYLYPEDRDRLKRTLQGAIRYARYTLEDFENGDYDEGGPAGD